jgi:AcrR family transcriptional regulator
LNYDRSVYSHQHERFDAVRSSVPKVTEEHLEARRRQIVDAALTCFSRQGFEGTSVLDICGAAELSPGAVYRYFPSKEDIIAAVCEKGVEVDETLFGSVADLELREALLRLIEVGMGELGRPEAEASVRLRVELWAEGTRNDRVREIMAEVTNRYRCWLRDMIRGGQERGEVDPSVDADGVARVLVGIYQGLVRERALDSEADVSAYVAAVKAIVGGTVWTGQGTRKERAHA